VLAVLEFQLNVSISVITEIGWIEMNCFRAFYFYALAFGLGFSLQAQTQPPLESNTAQELTPEKIIKAFSAKETQFYQAWMQYTYHRTAIVQVISINGIPTDEKMTTIADVVFNDNGSREMQVRDRTGNLRSVTYTKQDEDVINNLQAFPLTENELPKYNLKSMGKESVDGHNCYVFSVVPKSSKTKELYFQGKIWIDDRGLQIVRTMGTPVPQKKDNLFPEFETTRQMIDGQYWFPVQTHAQSKLRFSRDTIHIEQTIKYEDYKNGSKAEHSVRNSRGDVK
jgi:hypothetical protein